MTAWTSCSSPPLHDDHDCELHHQVIDRHGKDYLPKNRVSMTSKKKVLIVGAGPSGIVATKCMRDAGHDFTTIEQTHTLGGNWYYTEKTGQHTSGYRTLNMNTDRSFSGFYDWPIPENLPTFLSREQFWDYLNGYVDHFKLRDLIRFNTRLTLLEPLNPDESSSTSSIHQTTSSASTSAPSPLVYKPATAYSPLITSSTKWHAEFFDEVSCCAWTDVFDAVCIANGHHSEPEWGPEIPGMKDFKGDLLHSHDYRSPARFQGKNVIVLGMGISGMDIADSLEDSPGVKTVIRSTKRPEAYWQKTPGPAFYVVKPKQAPSSSSFRRDFVSKLFGFLKTFGLIRKIVQLVLMLFNSWKIFRGTRTQVRPYIQKIFPDSVQYADGSYEYCDAIIFCTGFKYHFPFLPTYVVDRMQSIASPSTAMLYKHCMIPGIPSLIFMSLIGVYGSFHPVAEIQAKWFAKVLSGEVEIPPREVVDAEVEAWKQVVAHKIKEAPGAPIKMDMQLYILDLRNILEKALQNKGGVAK